MKRSFRKYKIFHFILILYLIAAFTWWAILLFKKTSENHALKIQLSQHDSSVDVVDVASEFNKQKSMIYGEGLFFGLSILIGLILIYRAFAKEIQLNKRLSNFLLSITHELKTPIASINLINRTLLKKNVSKEKQLKLLDLSLDESRRLESLVNNILTAAQMESSYQFNFEEQAIVEILTDRIERFQRINPSRIFVLEIEKAGVLKLDKEAITKVFDNIIDNAIKYSPTDKKILIKLYQEKSKTILEVIDEGKGIAAAERQTVLEKFYRSEDENTRESKGTGLGLFIVKEILDAHKAELVIQDNKPVGTIIKIKFPN